MVEAQAYFVTAISDLWQHNPIDARDHALHALSIADREQDLAICCLVHGVLVNIGTYLGDHHLIRCHCEQGLVVALRSGEPTFEIFFRSHLALANFMSGAWDEWQETSIVALTLARRVALPRDLAYALAGRAMTLAFQGHFSAAEACAREAREVSGSGLSADRYVLGLTDIAEAALALEQGEAAHALAVARGFDSQLLMEGVFAGLMPAHLPIGLMLLAEAQAAAGDSAGALETARKLLGLNAVGAPYLAALASRAEGLAFKARGQHEAAVVCLHRSYEGFNALAMPFEAARSLLEQAKVGGKGSIPYSQTPIEAARQSLAIFERLGARPYIEGTRRLLRGLGFSPTPTRRARPNGCPLSEREIQVARLVAQGLTNPEIAQ
ncbi:MAG: hypothetical protein Q7O66_06560, partial [Dehalococcoidia bacterium]|nr:hypothetical protein [Dehalococcoidia bacterium]